MIFCSECFCDKQIKSMIISLNFKGNCPICGKKNSYLYDTDKYNIMDDLFDGIISAYTPQSKLPYNYDKSDLHLIVDELKNQWNIFDRKISPANIYSIIVNVSDTLYRDMPELFDTAVGIPEKYDSTYLAEHSILGNNKWDDFVNTIKYDNRFHTKIIKPKKLEMYLSYLRKDYKKGSIFFRGRLNYGDTPFSRNEMGAPPQSQAKEGRANSRGISRLYLADSMKTCIHEIRSGAFDKISIGRFRLNKDISVVDFKLINHISPFTSDFDCLEYLINKSTLLKIDFEMGRAVRFNDNYIEYVPTQYLCDFIKTLDVETGKKYSGVEYSSTLNSGGNNLAIFYPELFKCTNVSTFKIKELDYDFEKI